MNELISKLKICSLNFESEIVNRVTDYEKNSRTSIYLRINLVLGWPQYEKELRLSGNEGIKDEIDNKHLSRVQYFQTNQKEFGFKSNRNVKGLIVTLIKENIESYNGVDIIPFPELKEYIEHYTD